MRVIDIQTLRYLCEKYTDCEEQLKYWFRETKKRGMIRKSNATLHIPTDVLV